VAKHPEPKRPWLPDILVLAALAAVKLVLHLLTFRNYGYARDELYYIACGEHPALGYVDHPPLVPLLSRLVTRTIGASLPALRILPALAGAGVVFVAGLTARELGGKRFAQVLTALAVIVSNVYLFASGSFTTNAFEQLVWAVALYLLVVIVKRGTPKHWIWLGLVLGLGLMTKHSVVFLCAAVFGGLALSPKRGLLASRGPWIAAVIAALVFLPNVLWEVRNGWPTIEFLRRAEINRMPSVNLGSFLIGQALGLHVLLVPVWVLGLWEAFRGKEARQLSLFGWVYAILFVYFLLSRGKHYYLVPVYPPLLALGAVALERFVTRPRLAWVRVAAPAVLVIGGAVTAPLSLPVLSPEKLIAYADRIVPAASPAPGETKMLPAFQDMFGWEEMVATVAGVYHQLPPDVQKSTPILANNYGQAAAIDFFGAKYGLPKCISSHNNYWYWGPRDYTGEYVLSVGVRRQALESAFQAVAIADTVVHPYVVWYETNQPIYIWRAMKIPLSQAWPQMKLYY